jgi:hypothetical protein
LEHPPLLARSGNKAHQADFGEICVGFRYVPASQDSATALNGRKHAGAEDFAALAWLSNDQTHGKIRDMR